MSFRLKTFTGSYYSSLHDVLSTVAPSQLEWKLSQSNYIVSDMTVHGSSMITEKPAWKNVNS